MIVRAVVEYDGTDFCGFQYQPRVRSIAGELERTLSELLNEPIKITAAGRTDAGVHASGQVISFRTVSTFPIDRLAIAANSELPADLSIRHAEAAANNFSARANAIERTYVYAVLNRRQRSALLARYSAHVWNAIDLERCRTAAQALVGMHDFRSFCGMLPDSGTTVRTVRRLEVRRINDVLRIEIAADGFLHHMVRSIVGTLLECGRGRRDPACVGDALAARNRAAAGPTAAPQGLYLAGIKYSDGLDSFAEPALLAGVALSSECRSPEQHRGCVVEGVSKG